MSNETQSSRFGFASKAASVFLSATILASTFTGLGTVASTSMEVDAASNDYGLVDNITDGNILHCFCWKYTDITAMLPEIAEAGFTSVQTSPPQPTSGTGSWWWFYQPLGFYIGSSELGNKEELTQLCTEAEKYGIKVIADIVANHLAGDHSSIDSDLKDSQYWHDDIGSATDGNRYSVTHGTIGMPDLNTENSFVQQKVANYVKELESIGVDGIRWDAAKHIGLPSEGDNFWPTVTGATDLWHYGEILNNPGVDADSAQGKAIMKEYSNYMAITDSTYGMTLRNAFYSGTAPTAYGNWCAKDISNDKLVYWGESHDTWSNNQDWGYSNHMSQNVIDRAYAVAASRNGITALYFSRPSTAVKDDIKIGVKGSTHFTSKEVAEVNKFKNAMNGQKDYYTTGSNCSVVCREQGAVIVAGSGSNFEVTVPNGGSTTAPGTYTDQVSGSTWTVTSTTISGKIGDTGIAVIYNPGNISTGAVSASPSTGTSFTDTLTVTLNAKDVTNATYKTSEGASGSYTDGQTITVGGSTSEGSSVTVTLSGTKSDGSSVTATYTYKKTAPKEYPELSGGGFVFDNSTKNWSTVNAYVYDESGSTVVSNAEWPGVKMTDCGNGYWKYELDSKFTSSSNVQVIFNNGSDQIPASQEPGFKMTGTDKKLYEDSTWQDLPAASSLKVTSLTASPTSVEANNPVTLTAAVSGNTGTVSYKFTTSTGTIASGSSNSCTWTPTAAGTYTITVTATDSSTSKTATKTTTVTVTAADTTDPTVTANKASGTTFTTETLDVTLTLSNATSGTYSVDNGPTKTFTGSKTITIGEGKIGDSTVTVKTTAKGSDGTTKSYTFTYEKDYVVKTSNSSASLASQYSTNGTGTGKNKTITVDGSVSDWDSSMLIAQGAANDDPRVYRPNSMYEIPYDAYAMYAAWDDTNLYLMIEMTNVQDIVAPNDNYPLSSNATVDNIPMFIYIDTGKSSDAIGNNGKTQTGGYLWSCGTTVTNSFNRVIALSSGVGKNGPYIYGGDSTGINEVELGNSTTSGIVYKSGKGIVNSKVTGINGGYGEYNNRTLGDMCSSSSEWVDFNTLGHSSSTMDYNYEISIPLSQLGITKSDIESNGVGVLFVHSSGASGMDCLPYDITMNDNADQSDPESNPENSLEKSDLDNITCSFAGVGAYEGGGDDDDDDDDDGSTTPLQVNFGTDRSAPQLTTTALTLSAVGYGGTAPYQYQFYVDGTSVKSKSTTASYTWKPSTSGSHTIKCIITDSTGATATVSKTFTAESNGSDVEELVNSSTISATSISKGSTVKVTGKATGGTSPYTYAYYYKKSTASTWQNAGTGASATIKPAYTGTYTVRVKVTDSNGTEARKDFTVTVKAALTNSSTISATSISKGSTVKVTGKATGGTSPYTYAYYYKKSTASSWTSAGTGASATIKPSATGTYTVRVKVTDTKSTVARKDFTVTVKAALANSSTISSTSITKGSTVKVTGKATGGTSPYTYKYYYKKSTDSTWQDGGSGASATIKPYYTGTYTVRVKVTDAKSTVARKDFTVTVKAALANSSTISSTSITKGSTVKVTGKATGGTSPYTYKYYYKKSTDSTWQDGGSGASATIKPSATGTYTVRVKVTDAKSTVARKDFTVTVKAAALTNTSTISTTSITKGSTVKVTGAATGGTSPYTYAYYYKQSSASTWQDGGTGASATIKPAYTGTYTVRVKVTDAKGTVARKDFTVKVTGPLTASAKVSASKTTVGSSVTVTGSATGGTSPYSYEISYLKIGTSTWTTLKSYSTTASKLFTPASTGTYSIKVNVKDASGTVDTAYVTLTVS